MILDDYFNPSWPGVSEGACSFMRKGDGRLVPVAISSNKFFFTHGETTAAAYRRQLIDRHRDAKTSTVFDQDVVCFEPAPPPPPPTLRQRVTAHPLWLVIRRTPVGQALLKLKR